LLRLQDTFPNNQSWRFVPATYQFSDPALAASEKFSETYTLNFPKNQYAANFIGVKIGDVNETATFSANTLAEERSDKNMFFVPDKSIVASNEPFYIDIKVEEVTRLQGIQFALKYPMEKIIFEGYEADNIPEFSAQNIYVKNGKIGVSWVGNVITLPKNATCIRLLFRAAQNGLVQDWIKKDEKYLASEWYSEALQTGNIQFNFQTVQATATTLLYQNEPNPVGTHTTIRFSLPDADNVQLSIVSADGKVIKKIAQYFERGTHSFSLNQVDFGGYSGILYYTLHTKNAQITKKMILR
jgi:hypothetical protein